MSDYCGDVYTDMKKLIWEGVPTKEIASLYGVAPSTVYNLRNGRTGFYACWPDGTNGAIEEGRSRVLSKLRRMRKVNKPMVGGITEVIEKHRREAHIDTHTRARAHTRTGDMIVELDRDECDPQYVEWERKVEDAFRDVEWPHEKRFLGEYPKYEGYALRVGAYAIPDEETPSVEEHVRYCKELLEDWHRFNQ